MAGLECECGHVIKLGDIPNPNEWLLISDVEYDGFTGRIDAEELYEVMKSMFVCSQCKRIWIYWDGFQKPPTPYQPEDIKL